jgi:Glycosyltransferase like family
VAGRSGDGGGRALIAFGSAMSDPEAYRRYARPGIERTAEQGSDVYAYAAAGPLCRSHNLVLDRAATCDDLEALVVVQQHVEIVDPDFCRKVRDALSCPDVAVIGCAGASDVRSIAWWEGSVSAAPITIEYNEHGGGELPALGWRDTSPAPAEVDSVDGSLLVLSPWAVRNLRFDERLVLGHGYDFDLCQQARAAGRRVMTADLRVVHHRPLELMKEHELDLWVESHIQVADKWDGRMPGSTPEPPDWKRRARRAEAERDAARTVAYSSIHGLDAQVLPLERALEEMSRTVSWRLTAPVRRLNAMRRSRAARRRGRRP